MSAMRVKFLYQSLLMLVFTQVSQMSRIRCAPGCSSCVSFSLPSFLFDPVLSVCDASSLFALMK